MVDQKQKICDHVISCIRSGIFERHNDELSMRCPGCRDEKGHFSINIKKGLFNCFKCGISGSIQSLLTKNRQKWLPVIQEQSGRPKGYIREPTGICSLGGEPVSDVLDVSKAGEAPNLLRVQATRVMRYCLKRGMTKKQVRTYGVLVRPYDSRAYFPYWDKSGEITFWMGRATDEKTELKTIEMDDSDKPLFGRHVKINRNEVILLEGVFDHFVTPDSYALMGSNITALQIVQLREDGIKRIFLILDPDASRQSGNIARKLANFRFDVFPVIINGFQDPAKLGREKMTSIAHTVKQHHPIRPQAIYFSL